jgi:kinesin family protein 2/24
MVLRDSFI